MIYDLSSKIKVSTISHLEKVYPRGQDIVDFCRRLHIETRSHADCRINGEFFIAFVRIAFASGSDARQRGETTSGGSDKEALQGSPGDPRSSSPLKNC